MDAQLFPAIAVAGLVRKEGRMGERNKVVVKISSIDYTICGEESPEYIQQVASQVDRKMREITRKDPSLSTVQTAVLAALNLSEEVMRQHKTLEICQQKLRDMEKRLEASSEEGDALRQEIHAARDGLARIKQEFIRSESENRTLVERLTEMEKTQQRKTEHEGGSHE